MAHFLSESLSIIALSLVLNTIAESILNMETTESLKQKDSSFPNLSETDSEEEERKAKEEMEKINKELTSLSKEEQKRIKNLECEASRYLWYPDHESMNNIRCRCCPKCCFKTISNALEHLKTKKHRRLARRYVIDHCTDKKKIEERRNSNYERLQRWIEKKKLRRSAKRKEKLKNLTPEQIALRKEKFQQKKARRMERKKAAESK
ncbi:uncharacterized protein [Blastocystis hominis]|uniref:U1-type domain-containing protein n=1 Tax=Blastocystis hominis TaxID=12968 RepID=D8M384_BLAHO|nr:uncharacterized protein [Blastocystis hominis]CBK22357.2 unnamed protein product [Blastocystis hominis]|eukprot:XP_012896405.1 uncharacterized protein [Blastocystis hominis]